MLSRACADAMSTCSAATAAIVEVMIAAVEAPNPPDEAVFAGIAAPKVVTMTPDEVVFLATAVCP